MKSERRPARYKTSAAAIDRIWRGRVVSEDVDLPVTDRPSDDGVWSRLQQSSRERQL